MYVSLDGTDFRIQEPYHPDGIDPSYYSHKFKAAGLCYEVGLNIRTGDIVWTYGGLPCGEYSDLKLARVNYVHCVEPYEMTLADDGYKDPTKFIYPAISPNTNLHQKSIMQRHETVNHKLKEYGVLLQRFRQNKEDHSLCFYAVANLVQIKIDSGEKLNQV